MSRSRCAVAAVALVAILALGSLAGVSLAAGVGSGGPCVWTKHTKRVVKHVRRHGRRRRVVVLRHWWTCESQPEQGSTTTTTTPAPPAPPATDPDPAPDPSGPSRLGVESTEFSYTLSRSHVAHGDLIVELNNTGGDPHNLNIAPGDGNGHQTGATIASIGDVGPASQGSVRFDIPPGTYYLYCSLPQHEGYGMHADLLVDP